MPKALQQKILSDREIEVIETECADGSITLEDARREIAMIEDEYEQRLQETLSQLEGEDHLVINADIATQEGIEKVALKLKS